MHSNFSDLQRTYSILGLDRRINDDRPSRPNLDSCYSPDNQIPYDFFELTVELISYYSIDLPIYPLKNLTITQINDAKNSLTTKDLKKNIYRWKIIQQPFPLKIAINQQVDIFEQNDEIRMRLIKLIEPPTYREWTQR